MSSSSVAATGGGAGAETIDLRTLDAAAAGDGGDDGNGCINVPPTLLTVPEGKLGLVFGKQMATLNMLNDAYAPAKVCRLRNGLAGVAIMGPLTKVHECMRDIERRVGVSVQFSGETPNAETERFPPQDAGGVGGGGGVGLSPLASRFGGGGLVGPESMVRALDYRLHGGYGHPVVQAYATNPAYSNGMQNGNMSAAAAAAATAAAGGGGGYGGWGGQFNGSEGGGGGGGGGGSPGDGSPGDSGGSGATAGQPPGIGLAMAHYNDFTMAHPPPRNHHHFNGQRVGRSVGNRGVGRRGAFPPQQSSQRSPQKHQPRSARGNAGSEINPKQLFVSQLASAADEALLRITFEPFGTCLPGVEGVKLIRNHVTGESKKYAFVTFEQAESVGRALNEASAIREAGQLGPKVVIAQCRGKREYETKRVAPQQQQPASAAFAIDHCGDGTPSPAAAAAPAPLSLISSLKVSMDPPKELQHTESVVAGYIEVDKEEGKGKGKAAM